MWLCYLFFTLYNHEHLSRLIKVLEFIIVLVTFVIRKACGGGMFPVAGTNEWQGSQGKGVH